MTVTSTTSRSVQQTADGTNRTWDFPFKVTSAADLVLDVSIGGVVTTVANGFALTIDGSGQSGSVTYPTAPASPLPAGSLVTVRRVVARQQPYRLGNQGSFNPQTYEDAVDRVVMMVQEVEATTLGVGGDTTGALIRANNLADVASPGTARDNLGAAPKSAVTNGVSRDLVARIGDWVSLKNYKATFNSTDDSAALVAAMADLGAAGGSVIMPAGMSIKIDVTVDIPKNVHIVCPFVEPGNPGTNSPAAPWSTAGSKIWLKSTATLRFASSSGISGCMIVRQGVTFTETSPSAFAGTAITVPGDDVTLRGLLILGFNKAVYQTAAQRLWAEHVMFDCVHGFDISESYDVPRLLGCQGWPFLTINQKGTGPSDATLFSRAGNAFYFHGVVDDGMVTDCFSYGYFRGFYVTNSVGMVFKGCGADGTSAYAGAIGFVCDGTATSTTLIACKATGQETGYYFDTIGRAHQMQNCQGWGNTKEHIQFKAGSVQVMGGEFRDCPLIGTVLSAEIINVDGIRASGITNRLFDIQAQTGVFQLGNRCDFNGMDKSVTKVSGTGVISIPTIAAADAMLIPLSGEVFYVSGTANIGTLRGAWPGRRVTLKFLSTPTLFSGGSMSLKSNATWVTTANSTLTLVGVGDDKWEEVARNAW